MNCENTDPVSPSPMTIFLKRNHLSKVGSFGNSSRAYIFIGLSKLLFTNFECTTFFSCLNKRNISYERFISIKQLWFEIIAKIGCSKSVQPSTIIYFMFIIRTDFQYYFSQLFRVTAVFSRLAYHKKCFFCQDAKKVIYSKLVKNHFNVLGLNS